MARSHKPEDPWAGFVDVLSNIIMVVVFLVVLLGLAVFVLGQRVTAAAVQQAIESERARVAEEALRKQINEPPPDAVEQPERGAEGDREADYSLRIRETDENAGDSNFTVRSLANDPTEQVEIASEEFSQSDEGSQVTSSSALISIAFPEGQFRLLAENSEMIRTAVNPLLAGSDMMEIRAYAFSSAGSISEARRIAYYRAMEVRSLLLDLKVDTSRISVRIRESSELDQRDVTDIFLKPD